MADIQNIYSILLSRGYQDQLFSDLPGKRKKERGGTETLVDCPFCGKDGHFSYNSQRPVWKCWSCGESGDWIGYLEKHKRYDFFQALQELAYKAGVELSPQSQSNYQTYVRKADILETAQGLFIEDLKTAQQVLAYLHDRGYSDDEIAGMDLGAYTDRQGLYARLKSEGYSEQEIKDSGLMTKGFGEDYLLTLLWRDQAGRAIGIVGRSIYSQDENKERGLSKYKYSAGLQKDKGLIGFSSVRGSSQLILAEGVLDALYLNYKGFRSVAVGGTSLSDEQIEALSLAGTEELLLALDMDEPGQKATERIIEALEDRALRVYVLSLPEGYKDPDDLIRRSGEEAFQEVLSKAESGLRWMAKRILSKHDISTDRGLDEAIKEALWYGDHIHSPLEARRFYDNLKDTLGLSDNDLEHIREVYYAEWSTKVDTDNIQRALDKAQDILKDGLRYDRMEKILTEALESVQARPGGDIPLPYSIDRLTEDIISTPPALSTGYKKLDEIAGIPQGAITIIAGRPGHGKTILQLNLLVNMLRGYPGKKFYFFSYEEAKKALAVKLIMIMARKTLSQYQNYEAYLHYLREKRGSDPKIEKAIQEYESYVSTGRLYLSDSMAPAEELASTIKLLAGEREIGAVIVDYIQRIPLKRPSQGQRYLDIKVISDLLLQQAVSLNIPIILGAQLGRGQITGSKIKLDNMRESGDIEQDANLVLGLYTEAVEKMEAEDYQSPDKQEKADMTVKVLKNRAGLAGREYTLSIDRPSLVITDKTTDSNSIY
jgi:DNA primase catalytic core